MYRRRTVGCASQMEASNAGVLSSLVSFLRELASFAGMRGLKALAFVFLSVLLEGAGLLLLVPFLSLLTGTASPKSSLQSITSHLFNMLGAESRLGKFALLVSAFAILMVGRAFVVTVRDVTTIRLGLEFIQDMRSRLTHQLASARWDVVARLRHSRITHLMSADVQQLRTATHLVLGDLVGAVMLASQMAIALYLSPVLSLVAIAAVAIGFATLWPLLERARSLGDFVTSTNLTLINNMGQFLGALKLAMSQNLQRGFTTEFDAALEGMTAYQVQFVRRQTATRLAATTLAGLAGAAVIVLGVTVLNVSPSVLMTLLVIFVRMNGPAIQFHLDLQQLAQVLPARQKLRELECDLASAIAPASIEPASKSPPLGAMEFHKVCFHHDTTEKNDSSGGGVTDLDLVIRPGSIIGVTGPSGSGKTTFADLLVGLYPPQSGKILVDGAALEGGLLLSWRNSVGYVAQDTFLFHDTIRRNLLWGNPECSEVDLWDALETVGVADFVRRASKGLDTIVGERGTLLSGGERQRISLARALLRRPQLLILDEATNAIDVDTERAFLERLFGQSPRPSIVIIAHRPESLRLCERLLVFDKGEAVSIDTAESIAARLSAISQHSLAGRDNLVTRGIA